MKTIKQFLRIGWPTLAVAVLAGFAIRGLQEPREVHAALATTKTFTTQTADGATAEVLDLEALGIEGDRFTAQLVVTGTPDTCDYIVEGSLDNTFFDDFSGTFVCTSNVIFHVDGKAANRLRGTLSNLTGGTSPTVTLIVKAVGR